jgi:hypothetical protein
MIGGKPRHYLCQSVRRNGRPRQVVLAYLGQFDNIEDAYANATGRRRSKLAKYRNPVDVINEKIEAENVSRLQREYNAKMRASREAVRALLPRLNEPSIKPISPADQRRLDELDDLFKEGGLRE